MPVESLRTFSSTDCGGGNLDGVDFPMNRIPIAFDMETSDPDDMVTLCMLTCHPAVMLQAVTVTLGTHEQIGVVRRVLELCGRPDILVGSRKPNHPKQCVSPFHYQLLGQVSPQEADGPGHEVLAAIVRQTPATTVITGAPLSNLRELLEKHPDVEIARWVAQGGFAGDSVVPPEFRLPKFAGRETCPTYNFNGDPQAALLLLGTPRIRTRDLVSKNVCHGLVYDMGLHNTLAAMKDHSPGLQLIYRGMELYLAQHPEGKMLHDPLAACVAIDRDICVFREVEMYRSKGEWGARLQTGTATHIAIAVDKSRFMQVFTACSQ